MGSSARVFGVALCVAGALGLASCGNNSTNEQPATTTTETSASGTAAGASTSSPSTTATKEHKGVAEAKKTFGGLVPASLFEEFESCNPNGVADSMACSGADVGQFQFFASDSKAASTTQLLTELRSSRIVEDKGDRIVGWSTLGNMAIVTVVDNNKGQVMQQMVSADKQDPEKLIYDLGLAEKPSTTAEEASTEEDAPAAEEPAAETAAAEPEKN